MVGADRNRLETGAGAERNRGGGGRRDGNSHCRDGNNTETGSGEEEESLGASGSSGAEWSGAEE